MSSRTANGIRNIFWGAASKVVLLLGPFIVRTVLIQTLGSDFLGMNGLFSSVLNVLNLAELGFSSAIVFNMYEPIAKNDTALICALMALYKKAYRIIGFIVVVIGAALLPLLPFLVHGSYPQGVNIQILYLMFLANSAVSYFLFAYRNSLLIAHQREDLTSKVNIIVKTVLYISQSISLIAFHDYYVFVAIMIAGTVFTNVITAYLSKRLYPQFVCKGRLDKKKLSTIKKNIGGLFIGKVCLISRNAFDSIVISFYLGLNSVAIYENYYFIMNALNGLLIMVMVSLSAGIGNSIASESVEKNYKDFNTLTFAYSWISSCICICLLVAYQPFMTLWMGEEMLLPNYDVYLFCIYFYSLTMGDVRSQYASSAGLFWENKGYVLIEAITNLVLNILLGRFFGISGVITATIISVLLINFGWGSRVLFKHYFKNGNLTRYLGRHILHCLLLIAAALLAYWICCSIKVSLVAALGIYLVIGLAVSNSVFYFAYRKTDRFRETIELVKRCWKILVKR